jgi:hypothetical protein
MGEAFDRSYRSARSPAGPFCRAGRFAPIIGNGTQDLPTRRKNRQAKKRRSH